MLVRVDGERLGEETAGKVQAYAEMGQEGRASSMVGVQLWWSQDSPVSHLAPLASDHTHTKRLTNHKRSQAPNLRLPEGPVAPPAMLVRALVLLSF